MTIASRLVALLGRLPRAETHDVAVERDIAIPMPDGVVLRADRHYPSAGGSRPTVLVRSPYGRRGVFGTLYARVFAERGFQALIQSVRGTADSGGQMNPFHQERDDGLATLDWLRQQTWFDGRLVTVGPSYLGFVQWAIASEAAPELKAMSVHVGPPEFRRVTYPGEALAFANSIGWSTMVSSQDHKGPKRSLFGGWRLRVAHSHLPLRDADRIVAGKLVPFWQDWLIHDRPGDPWWQTQDHWGSVPNVRAPVQLIGGWYDIFLPDTLREYQVVREAGRQVQLIVGPWTHTSPEQILTGVRESLGWLRAYALDDRSQLNSAPVRIFMMGADHWRNYDEWPPRGFHQERWHLQAGRGLAPSVPAAGQPDQYRYNPADPTPSVGGALLSGGGRQEQQSLEARPDVLAYTSPPLEHQLDIIGAVQAELFVRSSCEYTDFFVRLCDVDLTGRSFNIADGLVRVRPGEQETGEDGVIRLTIDMWATAYRFKAGHRMRVVVASGAHPRWVRNVGSGEPIATAATLRVAHQTIYHDPAHPSAVVLPVAE